MSDFTEIMTAEDFVNQEARIVNGISSSNNMSYISFDPTSSEEASMAAYNATVSEVKSLMECNGKEIILKDVVVIPVTVQGADGNDTVCPRSVLLCEDGVYGSVSWGVYSCLQRMQAFKGTLHFDEGLKLKVTVVKTKRGKTVNLIMV